MSFILEGNIKALLKNPISLAMLAGFLCVANIISHYPGQTNLDSNLQYAQAVSGHFTDWQPPMMAWLWSLMLKIEKGTGPLFVFQVFFYWLGFGLLAFSLCQNKHYLTAWLVLAISILPPILMLNVVILKDVSLAVAMLSSFAIYYCYRSQNKRVPPAATVFAILLLIYATLVRTNGIFATPPLLIYMFYPSLYAQPLRYFAACLLLSALAFPISSLINHQILKAEETHQIRELQLFDVAGIAHDTRDISIFQDKVTTLQKIDECYSPAIRDALDNTENCHIALSPTAQSATATWLQAIAKHPIAYLKHRLNHFFYEINTYLPRHHPEDSKYNFMVYVDVKPTSLKEQIIDWIRYAPIFRPWFAWLMGMIILALSITRSRIKRNEAAICLATSGVLYVGSYLLIGVASNFRYQYWGMVSLFLAVALDLSERQIILKKPMIPWRWHQEPYDH